MSDCIDDRIEGNFVFLAVRATDGSGRRAGVDLPMDPADPTDMAVTAAESGRSL